MINSQQTSEDWASSNLTKDPPGLMITLHIQVLILLGSLYASHYTGTQPCRSYGSQALTPIRVGEVTYIASHHREKGKTGAILQLSHDDGRRKTYFIPYTRLEGILLHLEGSDIATV